MSAPFVDVTQNASPAPIISVRGLRRSFQNVEAVRGVSFDIYPGQVVGFIGANGAGKTTTMRIMATLDCPTSGTVEIGGFDVVNEPNQVRSLVGWMPDAYGTYQHMTVLEYLDFYGRAFGLRGAARTDRVREVMVFTDLIPLADRMINSLSKGMGQRLCLGRTLLHDPSVLILDEPAAGLDPKARLEFKNLIRLLAQQGKTIFISSHILSELGEMCNTLLFIDRGCIVHHGSAESLQSMHAAGAVFDVHVAGEVQALNDWLATQPGVEILERTRVGVRFVLSQATPEEIAALIRRMVQAGHAVTEFHREAKKLEDAFIEVLREADMASAKLTIPPPIPS